MSTITAILEADEDGTLHLPIPAELKGTKLSVTATIIPINEKQESTRDAAAAALRYLSEAGTFAGITDPVAWQREIRKDRPLPGRE